MTTTSCEYLDLLSPSHLQDPLEPERVQEALGVAGLHQRQLWLPFEEETIGVGQVSFHVFEDASQVGIEGPAASSLAVLRAALVLATVLSTMVLLGRTSEVLDEERTAGSAFARARKASDSV